MKLVFPRGGNELAAALPRMYPAGIQRTGNVEPFATAQAVIAHAAAAGNAQMGADALLSTYPSLGAFF
jgi:hypothetical protein